MPAATITTTAGPAFEIPKGSWGYRVYNNSDTAIYVLENAAVLTTTGIPVRPGSERVVAFAERNQNAMTLQAIHGGSGDKNVRYEILTVQIQATTGAGESATLDASDLQIGAVEIKNGSTDQRATVNALGALLTADAGPAWTTARGVSGVPVNSADMTTAAAVTDAPTSGQKLVIDDILVSTDTEMNVTFLEETSGTVIRGPIYLAANSTTQITLRGLTKLPTANKKLMCDASAAGNITVEVGYHSEA